MQHAAQPRHSTPYIKSSASPFIEDKYQLAHYWSKIGITDEISYPMQPHGYIGGRRMYKLVSISAPVDGSPVIWVTTADVLDGHRRVFRFDLSHDKGRDYDGVHPDSNARHFSRDDCVGAEQRLPGYKKENGCYLMPSAHLNNIARHPIHGTGCRAFLRLLRQKATAEDAPYSIAKSRIWHPTFLAWGDPNMTAEDDTLIKSSASPLIQTAKQHAAYWKAASFPSHDTTMINVEGFTLRLIHADTRRLDGVDALWVSFFDPRQQVQLTYKFDPRVDNGRDYTPQGPTKVRAARDDMVGEPIGETLYLLNQGRYTGPRKISSRLINDAARRIARARAYVKSLRGRNLITPVLIHGDLESGAQERDSSSSDDDEEEEEKKSIRSGSSSSVKFLGQTGPQPVEEGEEEFEEAEDDLEVQHDDEEEEDAREGLNASPTSSAIMGMFTSSAKREPMLEDA